jgi:hypothetical protein
MSNLNCWNRELAVERNSCSLFVKEAIDVLELMIVIEGEGIKHGAKKTRVWRRGEWGLTEFAAVN